MEHVPILAQIVEQELGGTLLDAKDITTGYAGYVYVVRTTIEEKLRTVCCKLTPLETEATARMAPVDIRVYGGRWEDLEGAYRTLSQAGIRVPELYAYGFTETDEPLAYQVMELLEGISIRGFLAYEGHERMEQLHKLAGEVLGRLHQITRTYDGPSVQSSPYALDWKSAFYASLQNVLRQASDRNEVVRGNAGRIERFISHMGSLWTSPDEFVFSHVDGLQAMAKEESGRWSFTGIVDIEDHHYVDPRFALAGYELSLHYEGREVPKTFWEGYGRFKPTPASYAPLRDLFYLYYLLSWLPGCYGDWKWKPEDQAGTIHHFEDLILATVLGTG
jgi:fructosamine-3-kinase